MNVPSTERKKGECGLKKKLYIFLYIIFLTELILLRKVLLSEEWNKNENAYMFKPTKSVLPFTVYIIYIKLHD